MYDLSSMSAQVFLWKRKRRCIMINVWHRTASPFLFSGHQLHGQGRHTCLERPHRLWCVVCGRCFAGEPACRVQNLQRLGPVAPGPAPPPVTSPSPYHSDSPRPVRVALLALSCVVSLAQRLSKARLG